MSTPHLSDHELRRNLLSLRAALLRPVEWDEVRLALAVRPVDGLVISRLTFAAKAHQRRHRPAPTVGGKGSPGALIACAVISALLLGATAAALGGGLIYVPAAIPVVTVAAVLGARAWSSRLEHQQREAAASGSATAGLDDRRPVPTDVRDQIEAVLWPAGDS